MNYLQEWSESGVDEKLTRLNVIPLEGESPLDYLFYADDLPRRNDGRVRGSLLTKYRHTEAGGWWCSGVDISTGNEALWGCFKPKNPRLNKQKNKPIKYEHPPYAPAEVFALRVPLHLWEKIAQGQGLEITPQDIKKSLPDWGFWQWLQQHPQVPLCVTEGAKKAGALITAGFAAIALPGIHGGYRTPKDADGRRIGRSHLIEPLQLLAQGQREIYFVFDQDRQPKTVQAVNQALRKTGYLLKQAGAKVKVISWSPDQGKGIDDFLLHHGEERFQGQYEQAVPLETWQAQSFNALTKSPQVTLDCRYLPPLQTDTCPGEEGQVPNGLAIPQEAALVALKSSKGTGKSRLLGEVVQQAIAQGRPVLVVGHRIRLVEELCQRFGIPYLRDLSHQTSPHQAYGLCIDSLHGDSWAQFDPAQWGEAIVIMDEIEQVIWHVLNSATCRDRRVTILQTLKTLMETVFSQGGQVFISDANLSDLSVEYLLSLGDLPVEPFVVVNQWQPGDREAYPLYYYDTSTPRRLVRDLENHIREGGKPFVCLSAQKAKSRWSTTTLESYFRQKFPEAKILRIDAQSLGDPEHPAHNAMKNLDQLLAQYDLVLASPAIETGVSIDLTDHFTSVWCLAQGVQSVPSVGQSLGRVRANIPRYLWAANYGFNQVGNGALSIPALLTSNQRLTQVNMRLLQQADCWALETVDGTFQSESLLCWAKMGVRCNAGMVNYRQSILALLREEGQRVQLHQPRKKQGKIQRSPQADPSTVAPPPSDPGPSSQALMAAIQEVRDLNYHEECKAIAQAEPLTAGAYRQLRKKLAKTQRERWQLRRWELGQRYGIPTTPALVKQDNQGWYEKLRLQYFLTVGRKFLSSRDTMVAQWLLNQGEGQIFSPDFNASQLGARIAALEILEIPALLRDPEMVIHNDDLRLQAIAAKALAHRQDIKTVLGIGLGKNSSPVMVIRRLVELLGYGLDCVKVARKGKKRLRLYQLQQPQDQRQEIFAQWLRRDRQTPGSATFSEKECQGYLPEASPPETALSYQQLPLF